MVKRRAYKPEPKKPTEVDGITTADGLVAKGPRYARRIGGMIHITDEGHALLGEELRTRARENEGKWHGVTGVHEDKPRQPGL